jgi:hypothetical protein
MCGPVFWPHRQYIEGRKDARSSHYDGLSGNVENRDHRKSSAAQLDVRSNLV